MPITPRFVISQSESHVNIDIRVPHVRVSVDSIHVALSAAPSTTILDNAASLLSGHQDDNEEDEELHNTTALATTTTVHFSSPPYLLMLNFEPHQFHERAAEACATYEPTIEHGMVRLSLQKQVPGVMWNNLDLIGRMAQPKKSNHHPLSSSSTTTTLGTDKPATSQWLKEVTSFQTITNQSVEDDDETDKPAISSGSYGFLKMFGGIFADLNRDGLAREMLELPWDSNHDQEYRLQSPQIDDHDDDIWGRRRQERWRLEQSKFDKDRWLQDLDIDEDDYVYQCALAMKPHWMKQVDRHGTCSNTVEKLSQGIASLFLEPNIETPTTTGAPPQPTNTYFTESETLKMHEIPYPILPKNISDASLDCLLLGLWDILFAYVYDHLTTDGERTVESAWTISTLSASLSCLEDYSDVVLTQSLNGHDGEDDKDHGHHRVSVAVISSFRRVLVYPYIRNLQFAQYCGSQVVDIFSQGPRCILRCLLQTRTILEESELYYLGNKLFLDPYLAWLQRDTDQIGDRIKQIQVPLQRCVDKMTSLQDLNFVAYSDEDIVDEEEDESSEDDDDSEGDDDDSEDDDSDTRSEDSSTEPARKPNQPSYSGELLDHNLGLSHCSSILE